MSDFKRLVELRLDATPRRLRLLRAVVHAVMESLGADAESTECTVLAVTETCMNIIQHAYDPGRAGEIVVEILNNHHQVKFRVTDFAAPVDAGSVRSRDLEDLRPGGLGVHLIHQLMDDARFVPAPPGAGNVFEMTKRWTPAANEDGRDEVQ